MIRSDSSIAVKELFLKHGFEYGVAVKQYATHHEMQDWQFRFLFRHGLAPDHNFLDLGCGWLRLAQVLLPYLEPGRYHGIDSTQVHLDMGLELLARSGVALSPKLLCDTEFSFDKFGTSFDFAFCHAVFTHLSHDQIVQCMTKLKAAMNPEGVCYCTFYRANDDIDKTSTYKISAGRDLRFSSAYVTLGFLRNLFEGIGLSWEYLGRCGHPTGQHMIEVRFSSVRRGAWYSQTSRHVMRRMRRAVRSFVQE